MDVTSLYTNIPQEEGINIVYTEYEFFCNDTPSFPKRLLAKGLRLTLQENLFQFNKRNYFQTHETTMGTKTPIFSWGKSKIKCFERYIDDIIFLWHTNREVPEKFIEQANKQHPTIRFTAEISCTDATFVDTTIYKDQRFNNESVLDRTHSAALFKGWRVAGSR